MAKYFEEAPKKIVEAFQRGLGVKQDGYFGMQTLMEGAIKFHELGIIELDLPLATPMYDGYLQYGDPNQFFIDYSRMARACKDHDFAANGTFFNRETNKLVSIAASDGEILHTTGSKVWKGKAEGVIFYKDGNVHYRRLKYLPEIGEVDWAIGGCTLHDFHPDWEGFTQPYNDIFRYCFHTIVGVTDNDMIVIFTKKMGDNQRTGKPIVKVAMKDLGLKYAILLDGGSMGACHAPGFSVNKYTRQNNIIGFNGGE